MNMNMYEVEDVKCIIKKIALEVSFIGGSVLYVGGYVRDKFLGKKSKDIDVEVYNITLIQLKELLSRYGVVDEVGASFGVLKIQGLDVDFAVPRREYVGSVIDEFELIILPKQYSDDVMSEIEKIYPGYKIKIKENYSYTHTDFIAIPDPFISMEKASRRRDFTINAIMEDVLTGEVFDFHGGLKDLQDKVLRHIDDIRFTEDPVRVLRACQLAPRCEFTIALKTIKLCRTMDLSSLPKERIFDELKKALLKTKKPSVAFEAMREMGVLEKLFPELLVLTKCEQRPDYHPEGNVWVHTMMVIDELAKLRDKSKNPLGLMLSGVCHDLGKPNATKEDEDGMLKAKGHELEGVPIAGDFMSKLTTDKALRHFVANMVQNHMRPNTIALHGNKRTIRKLIVDTDVQEILLLAEADHKGRGISEEEKDYSAIRAWFDQRIEEVSTSPGKIDPIVTGKDLIAKGIKPGIEMGKMLKEAFELQLDGKTKEEIINILIV